MNKELQEKLHYYLPWGIAITTLDDSDDFPRNIVTSLGSTIYDYIDHGVCDCTPHLRPLTSLTKPITVQGYNNNEAFVPIIEIAKLYVGLPYSDANNIEIVVWNRPEGFTIEETATYGCSVKWDSNVGEREYLFKYWERLERFSLTDVKADAPRGFAYQLRMFELLFRWHFWIGSQELFQTGEIIAIND